MTDQGKMLLMISEMLRCMSGSSVMGWVTAASQAVRGSIPF
jgi:hypothetical protein